MSERDANPTGEALLRRLDERVRNLERKTASLGTTVITNALTPGPRGLPGLPGPRGLPGIAVPAGAVPHGCGLSWTGDVGGPEGGQIAGWTVDYDPDSLFDAGTGYVTIPADAAVFASLRVSWAPPGGGTPVVLGDYLTLAWSSPGLISFVYDQVLLPVGADSTTVPTLDQGASGDGWFAAGDTFTPQVANTTDWHRVAAVAALIYLEAP